MIPDDRENLPKYVSSSRRTVDLQVPHINWPVSARDDYSPIRKGREDCYYYYYSYLYCCYSEE